MGIDTIRTAFQICIEILPSAIVLTLQARSDFIDPQAIFLVQIESKANTVVISFYYYYYIRIAEPNN